MTSLAQSSCLMPKVSTIFDENDLFKPSRSEISIFLVWRSSHPTDSLIMVIFPSSLGHVLVKELHSIIIHKNACSPTLELIRADGGFQRLNGRVNHSGQRFHIDWHLNGDMGK